MAYNDEPTSEMLAKILKKATENDSLSSPLVTVEEINYCDLDADETKAMLTILGKQFNKKV